MDRRNPEVTEQFNNKNHKEMGVSTIALAELYYGIAKSTRQNENSWLLAGVLIPLAIMDFDNEAALHYGQIRFDLQRRGQMIGGNDLFIAAHALALDCVLVTNNTREFERVEGLKLENWVN